MKDLIVNSKGDTFYFDKGTYNKVTGEASYIIKEKCFSIQQIHKYP